MKRLGVALVAVAWVAGCTVEVVDDKPFQVESTAQAVTGVCPILKGSFTNIWTDNPKFTAVADPPGGISISSATSWLTNHTIPVNLSTGEAGLLTAWNDDSLGGALVSYMLTDTLWALHALQTNPASAGVALQMKKTLVTAGWYGNFLYDSIFHDVGLQMFKIIGTNDIVHGTLLDGNCPSTDGSRTTQVRTFQMGPM